MEAKLTFGGKLKTRHIKGYRKAPLLWKLRNLFSPGYIRGWFVNKVAAPIANKMGLLTLTSELRAVKITADGRREDFGVVCRRVVTTVFVNDMVDNLITELAAWGDYKFHDSGIGVTGPVIGDTDIETSDGEARVAGTQIEGASANIYKSVGTITYTTTKAITEHGLFNIITAGILMDRHTFTAINVVNTDQIEFTYELTCTAGG
jgi:hypothetical protein